MCAYMRHIVQDAQKYGGKGWLTYDAIFRKNRPGPGARWDQLDPSLRITWADGPVAPCTLCN
jgi:hypothetical protein